MQHPYVEEKKKRINETTKKGANLIFFLLYSFLCYISALCDVGCGNGFCAHIGWDNNQCVCNEHFYTSGGPNDRCNTCKPSSLSHCLFSSPSIVPLSKPPHHYILSQLLTRSFSHCYIQLIAQDAAHTPLALVALRAVNLAATVTRDGPTVEKVATATSSSATAMYVFSSRLFSYPLVSYRHVHPFLMFQKSSAKN